MYCTTGRGCGQARMRSTGRFSLHWDRWQDGQGKVLAAPVLGIVSIGRKCDANPSKAWMLTRPFDCSNVGVIDLDRYSFLLGRVHEITIRLGRYRSIMAQLPCSSQRLSYELLFSDEADELLHVMTELASLLDTQQTVQPLVTPSASQPPSGLTNQSTPTAAPPGLPAREFTIAELAEYDGSAGRPAYVAVNGVVYDMSTHATWGGGSHFGLLAGRDLTAQFSGCHGQAAILSRLPVVGTLITQTGG